MRMIGRDKRVTRERLQALLYYDSKTGVFTWIKKHCDKVVVGAEAGSLDPDGYVIIYIDGRNYRAHHLAFLYMKGYIPAEVDHEDLVKSHNKWTNLRESDHFQNCQNTLRRKHNKSGKKGVYWRKDIHKYAVQIRCRNKVHSIGYFVDLEDAADAYDTAAIKYHGEFARLNGGRND